MKNRQYRPKMSFRERIYRFMSGRYGGDTLGTTLMAFALAMTVANIFARTWILYLLSDAILLWALFRILSRNRYKRMRENQAFCGFFRRIKGFFSLQKSKRRDRKTHVYRKCPHCKSVLRLPRIKGAHTVNCPRCHNRFDMKV